MFWRLSLDRVALYQLDIIRLLLNVFLLSTYRTASAPSTLEQCCTKGIELIKTDPHADCNILRSLESNCGPYAFVCCTSEKRNTLCDAGKRMAVAGTSSCHIEGDEKDDEDRVREQCCDCCLDGIVNSLPGTDCSLLLRTISRPRIQHQNSITSCNQIYVECCKNAKSIRESRPMCPKGFVYSEKSGQCKDEDECSLMLHNCTDGYRCENTLGSFKCVRERHCGTGYTVQHESQSCVDIDECENGLHNCGRGLVCHNVPGTFKCIQPQCPPDQRFDTKIGACLRIKCPSGFELRISNVGGTARCHDIDECNKSNPCSPHQTCINTLGSFRCDGASEPTSCPDGYTLRAGQCVDIDECVQGMDGGTKRACPEGTRCINTDGSYECLCERNGYEYRDGQCLDVNECVASSPPCPPGSHCRNLNGSFECICSRGFIWNYGTHDCDDIDECKLSPSKCEHQCVNLRGSYFCLCKPGFQLMQDGRSCKPIDQVSADCPNGYVNEGGSCRDLDECAERRSLCNNEGVCVNIRGGFRCERVHCPQGYVKITPTHCQWSDYAIHKGHCPDERILPPYMPISHFYSFVSIPSDLTSLPTTIFIVKINPRSAGYSRTSMPIFTLKLDAQWSYAFKLIIRSNSPRKAELLLTRPIHGPQILPIDIITEFSSHEGNEENVRHEEQWIHSVAHLTVFVSEHEF